ncbi:MAG: hypothetical protein JNK58_11510 [Phycisphaerae bacterium]|nr:hypothetical protein [Phycisphaerae bacterium]
MSSCDSPDHRRALWSGWLGVACLLCLTAGCYEHVVDAKGFGTQGITIHEANLPDESESSDPAEQRARRRRDLNELNRSIPPAPRAY